MMEKMKEMFSFKYIALAMLIFQNTFLIIFMSLSRTGTSSSGEVRYASSSAVASMELVKMMSCLTMIFYECCDGYVKDDNNSIKSYSFITSVTNGAKGLVITLYNEVYSQPYELLKVSVPSLLYTIQNNLLYYALSNLDAATFQIGYQMKILTTAVFSYIMLGKKLSVAQWISLVLLTVGVSMAQLSANQNKTDNKAIDTSEMNTTFGFVAVMTAAVTSGFAGVYFERILKSSTTTLWMRNVQMGIFSIIIAFITVYFHSSDYEIVVKYGFFHGYNFTVIATVLLQAVGGLVVAVVVKYADNILKGFAASFSIIGGCIISYFILDFHPTWMFVGGAVLVNIAMVVYMKYPHVPSASSASRTESSVAIAELNCSDNSNTSVNGVRSRHPAAALNYLTQTKAVPKTTHGASNPFLAGSGSSSGKSGAYVLGLKEKDDIV